MLDKPIQILSTALLSDSSQKSLRQEGFSLFQYSFIETSIQMSNLVKSQIEQLKYESLLVLFTSVQAVNAVKLVFNEPPANWKICCISGATATEIGGFFGEATIVAKAKDGLHLLQAMENIIPQKIVFFCGNKRLDTVPNALVSRGFDLLELQVYETKLQPQKIEFSPDAVLFFSPSGVDSFFELNALDTASVLFAIGDTTASAIRQKVNNKVNVAPHPDKEKMVHQVIDFFKQQNS